MGPGWAARGWRRKAGEIENLELWQSLVRSSALHDVQWTWVRGHRGHPKNEYANDLAVRAAERRKRRPVRWSRDSPSGWPPSRPAASLRHTMPTQRSPSWSAVWQPVRCSPSLRVGHDYFTGPLERARIGYDYSAKLRLTTDNRPSLRRRASEEEANRKDDRSGRPSGQAGLAGRLAGSACALPGGSRAAPVGMTTC